MLILTRNCEKLVKCGGEAHHSLLHPNPVDRPAKAQTVTKEYGGKKKDSSEDDVSTKCTEACGSDLKWQNMLQNLPCLSVSKWPMGEGNQGLRHHQ